MLYSAAAEIIGIAAGDVAYLLHIAGVAGIALDGSKADQQVVKAQLLCIQLVHGVFKLAGDAAVHLHFIGAGLRIIAEAGLVVVRVGDADRLAGGSACHGVLLAGAVVRKAEEGGVVIVLQPDARVGSGLPDLLAGGELGVFIGHIPAPAVAVSHMRMGGSIKVALAADVQAGIVVYADEFGAGGALTVVVVQRLIGHQQLQELVAARAQRADLRDGVGIVEHRAEAGDAALHLALDQQIGRGKAALRTGVLTGGVGDVVHHHAHDAAIAALGLTGQRVGIVSGQCGKTGSGLLACCQRGSNHVLRGCSRRSCAGRTDAQCLLEPAGKIAAQNGTAGSTAAGKRQ